MADRRRRRASALRWLGQIHVELGILLFCIVIIAGTGRTEGPVFDTIGPDFFPTALAVIVGALTLLQIILSIAGRDRGDPSPGSPDRAMLRNSVIFFAATGLYVLVLSQRWAPLFLATSGFMACTMPLIAHRLNWRDAGLGAVIGLGLGLVLEIVFTRIVIIDL